MGFGIMFPPSIIIIAYNFEKYRAISTGMALSGSSFGVLCLSPIFYYISQNVGWRVTLRVQSSKSHSYTEVLQRSCKVFVEHTIAHSSRKRTVELLFFSMDVSKKCP